MKTKFFLFLLFSVALIGFNSCKLGRFVIYNFADVKDYKKFKNREIKRDSITFEFYKAENEKVPNEITIDGKAHNFEKYLARNKTVAFLVIQNDSILYENYWRKRDKSSIHPSFSVAKSVTSILIGCAIEDGFIHSVHDPVTNYIPELSANGFEKVTIEHLLQMTSGIEFSESYINPFGEAASFYYGTNLRKEVAKLKLKSKPGQGFEYISGDTQLLGWVLERALKDKTISQYLEEKIWIPLQMEYDASWSLDRKKNGLEKTFCCLNARARDFAKIGRLYLNNGNWNGRQIVSSDWIYQSTKVDTSNGSAWYYQYQWWLPTPSGDFMAEGILGQFIYVNPENNLIIVRLGKNYGKADWWDIFVALSGFYSQPEL